MEQAMPAGGWSVRQPDRCPLEGIFMSFRKSALLLLIAASLCALDADYESVAAGTASAVERSHHAPPEGRAAQKPNVDAARSFSAQDDEDAIVPGFPDIRFLASSEQDFLHALPPAGVAAPWLALSAGGADGAYGAGLLSGWSTSGKRPNFAVVTGVSAGALVAPFAFLGSRYDEQLRTILTTINDADVFEGARTSTSLLDNWPFRNLLEKQITPQLVADVAAEHRHGRRLFVVTTNLDAGRTTVWNMGAIAARGDDAAIKLFRDVLLASASIPGVFPPVFIDVEAHGHHFKEMHADGGIGGPFFIGPESWLTGASRARLPARQIYVIVNEKLRPDFEVTPSTTLGALGRAFSAAVKTGTRVEIADAAAASKRDGIDFEFAFIPDSFNHPSQGLFDPDYVKALYDFGYRQAQEAFERLPIQISQQPSE
jgi:predicted patatin/cPLA2 family phospholipase